MGRLEEAVTFGKRALDIRRVTGGQDDPKVAISLNNLALIELAGGEFAAAEVRIQEALAIGEKTMPDHPTLAAFLINLSEARQGQNDTLGAEPLLRRAVSILEKSLPGSPRLADALTALAAVFITNDKLSGAETLLSRAAVIREQTFGVDSEQASRTRHHLSQVLRLRNRSTEAAKLERTAFR